MTRCEAGEKLAAYLECQEREVKGIYEDCNKDMCDDCYLCYAQGNTGEHIESVKVAIQALEKQIPKKVVMDKNIYLCPNCGANTETDCGDDMLDYRLNFCDNCGQKLDWSDL